MVGGVATAGIAATACTYLVLQQQTVGTWCCSGRYQMLLLLRLLLLLWPSQQQKVVPGSGPPVGTEAIGVGRSCGNIVRVVGTCDSWASPRNPEGKNGENVFTV